MRFPVFLSLILLASGAFCADPSRASHPEPVAPPDPLAAAQGVARSLIPPGPRPQADGDPVPKSAPKPAPPARGPKAAAGQSPVPVAAGAGSPTPDAQHPAPPDAPPGGALRRTRAFIGPPPPLALSPSQAIVPLGETRLITVTGTLDQPAVTADPADVVSVAVAPGSAPGAWTLTLRGATPGEAAVRVTAGEREQLLPAQVMKYAGQVAPAQVEVTGQPAPAELVVRAARAAVGDAAKLEPGAALTLGSPVAAAQDLAAGQTADLSFPVTLSGPDLLPVKTTAVVTVRDRELEPREVGVLLYSNDPERVARPGVLFAAELTPDRPARLLYHHLNATIEPLRVRLELINPTDEPAEVQVIEGAAGPTPDAIEAGHRAASRYIRGALQDIGLIVRVPAHSEQAISLQRMTPGATVSGLFGLRSFGTRLFVRVAAEADAEPAVALRPAESPAELSDHVYPSPRRPLSARYVVGKGWAFLKLGADPVVGHGSRPKLAGNYGVTYEVAIDLSNPTDQPQTVTLALSPDAGQARGVFVIDGTVVEAPAVGPPVEADLATFRLQPGEHRAVRVETMPVGGSSYPARLVIRPADPPHAAQAASNAR